ncbi:hypothetical protein [Acetobacterium woodii]|uniref:Putative phage replication initiation protein n=1 Tax=Acetobacterium woodii (strain ATCC 29683 / DSM 1030 / JCM 2381 / KCTC 1655 / WB1) TaxID=931626 RepID=H6LIV7_ACEWD|nr:hypothetical protein [Acetobacterium woodii]AFA49846.1 putative phage replication initiation protein [Acetobacterium woodii DSM 1030]
MAERRMFAKTIIDSDAFLDMPLSAQALYFHLCMRADDEGFINSPKKIQRIIGCKDDDFKLLLAKSYVIVFETGVIVIKHWKMHNYIRKDRLTTTVYQEERALLEEKPNGAYTVDQRGNCDTKPKNNNQKNQFTACQPYVSQMSDVCQPNDGIGKVRLGKGSIGEVSIDIVPGADASAHEPANTPIVIKLPLVDKTNYSVIQSQVDEWSELYPAVNVIQELRKMRGWLDANPKNRKTKGGIKRFIANWLAREQDKGCRGGSYSGYDAHKNKATSNQPYVYDGSFNPEDSL